MATSLAQIAKTMDALDPPDTLRALANRHRWPEGLPPVLSLRYLAWRHDHPETTRHRLLWLNSWLIHAFQVSLCNAVHVGRMLAALVPYLKDAYVSGVIPSDKLVDALDISTEQLQKAFDLEKQQLVDAFPSIAHSFTKQVKKWLPPPASWIWETVTKPVEEVTMGDMLGKLSPKQLVNEFTFMTPDQIIEKVGVEAGKVVVAFCTEIAGWLENTTGYPINFTWFTLGEDAPNRPARAQAIGELLGRDYDIASLCEVFEPDRLSDIVQGAQSAARVTSVHPGVEPKGELAGSGLLTVTFDGRSKSSSDTGSILPGLPGVSVFDNDPKNVHVFSNQGDHVRDADAWSRKGVLLTVLDLGVGKVDLYTTHLYEGGSGLEEPTNDQRWAVKLSQIQETADFIAQTHNEQRVAVLMGDFNVARDEPEFATMKERFAAVGLVDLWPFWSQEVPAGRVFTPRGSTNNTDLCQRLDPNLPFCSEPGPNGGRRIDFIFVEQPRAHHGFNVDFSRIRRRGDLFAGSKLSDHLGLDVLLIVSPRAHLPA